MTRTEGSFSVLSVRPKIAELVFQVYGRSLHPELFQIHSTRQVERDRYRATVQITSAGHVISWHYQGLTLTEVAASAHHPLPEKRRLMSHQLRGNCCDHIDCRGGARYEVQFSLERAGGEMFHTFQKELTLNGMRQGMLHKFDASGRFGLGAVSYINVESRQQSLIVQALHTFPDDYAIVKSQSKFWIPG